MKMFTSNENPYDESPLFPAQTTFNSTSFVMQFQLFLQLFVSPLDGFPDYHTQQVNSRRPVSSSKTQIYRRT